MRTNPSPSRRLPLPELLHGVQRAASLAQRAKRQAFVEHLLAQLPVAPFDLLVARIHASVWAQLAAQGKSVERMTQSLSTALAMSFSVVTRDERELPEDSRAFSQDVVEAKSASVSFGSVVINDVQSP